MSDILEDTKAEKIVAKLRTESGGFGGGGGEMDEDRRNAAGAIFLAIAGAGARTRTRRDFTGCCAQSWPHAEPSSAPRVARTDTQIPCSRSRA